jgi:hypothetical protein
MRAESIRNDQPDLLLGDMRRRALVGPGAQIAWLTRSMLVLRLRRQGVPVLEVAGFRGF